MSAQTIPASQPDASFKRFIFQYIRVWPWFLASLIAAAICAFLYLRYTVSQYNISATILIKDDKKGPTDLADAASAIDLDIFKSSKSVNNEVEVLKSKRLMQKVLSDLSLQVTYYAVGSIKTTELYGSSAPVRITVNKIDSTAYKSQLTLTILDNNTFEIKGSTKQYRFGEMVNLPNVAFTAAFQSPLSIKKSYLIKFNDLRQLGLYYNNQLSIAIVNKDASVLNLNLIDPVPQKGQDIINKLIDDYNLEAIEDKNLLAQNTVNFIDGRLKYLLTELTGVEKNVETFKQRNEITDIPTDAQVFINSSSEYANKSNDLEIQISVLNSIESYLSKQENKYSLVPSSLGIQDPTLNALIDKFNSLQLDRNRLLRGVQEASPIVTGINEQLDNLRINILENLRNIKKGLIIARNNLQRKGSTLKSRINTVPAMERGLTDIKREQVIKETLYGFLLQKREEAAISLASAVANSRIIDRAYVDAIPVEPKKSLVFMMAIIVGIALPVAGVSIRELLNTKVQSIADVARITDVPVLGEIAHNSSNETLIINANNRSEMAERFRLVRSNLQFAAGIRQNKVIMVTSSRSGEGKTFYCINFAASLALTGKKVALLEFDIRKPKILKDLGIAPYPAGITNFLIDPKLTLENILHPLPQSPGLSIISAGPIPPNPSELLLSHRLEELITQLKEKFDYVVLDTSPIGQVSDAFTIAKFVDTSIYIVRYNYTFKEQLNIVKDIHQNNKMNGLMIVMNDVKRVRGLAYGYGGYSYGYGYGGYGEEETSKGHNWISNIFRKKS